MYFVFLAQLPNHCNLAWDKEGIQIGGRNKTVIHRDHDCKENTKNLKINYYNLSDFSKDTHRYKWTKINRILYTSNKYKTPRINLMKDVQEHSPENQETVFLQQT